ncbi:MAG: HD domain-containing phosphohydrolase [Methylococcaceae bacterium]
MKKILIVDDEPTNLHVMRQILKDTYRLLFAPNGEKALQAANIHHPDLILLDIMMPDMSGYEVCKQLKKNSLTENIPVIFVSAMSEVHDEIYGFDVGAVDYISKPVSAPIVLRRVQNHLSLVKSKSLEESHKAAIFMLGEAGHYNDTDTGVHIWRMADYAGILAKATGWSQEKVECLKLAATMHDTGKIGIPDSILKAPRKLTADEWEIMKTHSEIGAKILENSKEPIFVMAAEIARHHHEKWDGSGYPLGLIGEAIPESARIVAIADVFDALTMERPYKKSWTIEDAFAEIQRGANHHFDPKLVTLFEHVLPDILQIKNEWQSRHSETK